ncbi:hypothetical protein PHK61_30075 [Actinomycetospora lutea]|uniref:hypothetical protein n=1 Tax=Actinomycetospora lutea TaxID=663604 RepID=UPI0023671AE7|nr:hypothetical protein [Actinomycetospora lutea]MDD7942669.1 hypothetical protein [Actinomycetospora lutea]
MTGRDDERPRTESSGAAQPDEASERRTEKVDLTASSDQAPDPSQRPTETVDTSAVSGGRHRGPDDASTDADDTPPSGVPAASSGSGSGALAAVGADSGEAAGEGRRGRVRYQDPATTRPREPTVAEQRARREAQRRERAQRDAAAAAEERKKKIRKRVLVGGGVAVGVVALVAVVYAASAPDEVEAQCVDPQGVVVPDENCGGTQQGGYYDSGGHFVPIFIGGFGNQYHYNYGSRSPVGTVAQGGSTAPPPSGTSVRSGTSGSTLGTSNGSSGTVSRGGLGVGGSSSGTSGSSGSSGSSSGSSGSSSGS